MKISVVYEATCINVQAARQLVEEVCRELHLDYSVQLVDRDSPDTPAQW